MLVLCIKALFLLIITLLGIMIPYLGYYIFGFFKFIRARKLTDEELKMIKEQGISHYTSNKGKVGIEAKNYIKNSKHRTSYSNHFKKCTFFFANGYFTEDAYAFNCSKKHSWKITINNLTDIQLSKLKIRNYDKAIMYQGDFLFNTNNQIYYHQVERPNIPTNKMIKDFFKFLVSGYCIKLIVSVIIAGVVMVIIAGVVLYILPIMILKFI